MNEASPLVPQGSFEAQSKRKSHVRIAVFSILAVHVVVLGGLLILGCKPESRNVESAENLSPTPTNDLSSPPPFGGGTEVVSTPPPVAPAAQTTPAATLAPAPAVGSAPVATVPPVISAPAAEVPPTTAATEHKIVSGDNFSTLAKHYGVTAKAIQDANPNLVPTKLKLNDIVKIPAKSTVVARAAGAPSAGTASDVGSGSSDIYKVKSNDTLGSIAKAHKTSVKELQSLNNLKTTMIRVGQPLKLPSKSAPAPATPSASAELVLPASATGNSASVPVSQ